MLLTLYLALVCCSSITILLVGAVAFVQKNEFFSSAPKEALELLKPRDKELFPGAHAFGWVMMILSALSILGAFIVGIGDGFRNNYTFLQFFIRFAVMLTIYKVFDMVFFDYFVLCRFGFFQHYFPEAAATVNGRKYGFNIRSQLLKLFVIFPALSALAAWICTLF